ncbi:MAG: filamentous hemagglutinin N-terminal domain-containing protein, partial [Caldimonas sp.]
MKTRPTRIARTVARRGRFALHPLSFAICLGLSGAAWALPQGGKVVTGDATISKPNTNTEIIRQTTDKAIIDWKSFSIAAGEKVRFYQPSSTSVTLNRVTGYDPSYILGQMSSNGKIFLLNPYGVVFGAGARVDVGGLVVSTLSMANNDFLASRYSLTSVDPVAPAQRGAIVNEGTISAPGGIVVLAGPSVSNTGTIVANGGRVGLVAANSVSIDVEGDGLLFFQTSATEAKNRLEQLGRIQADGGSVELRAAARGAFADTVLNMTGVVQAKTIGTREGKIVIDGGNEGLTAISGQLVASGLAAGEHGGAVTVQGQYFLLDNGSRIEASGDAGGGAIRVGGDFHGANPDIRNAEKTIVMPGAELHADAITRGDGGSLVVWANDWTRYYGNASAKGGAQGGNGGSAEVSGKQSLDYAGFVDTRAPYGAVGTLLMDPANFTIQTAGGDSGTLVLATNVYTDPATVNSNITPTTLVGQLNGASITIDTAAILLAGAGTITVVDPVSWNSASSLTLKADSTITVNAAGGITNAGIGGLNLFTGNGVAGGVVLNGAIQLAGGSLVVADKAGTGRAASFTSGAGGTISTAGGVANVPGGAIDIQTTGAISTRALTTSGGTAVAANGNAAGSVTLDSSAGAITTAGAINAIGGAGVGANRNGGAGGTVAITANGLATVNANVTTTGGAATGAGTRGAGGSVAVQGNGVTVAAGQTLDADDNTITINGGGGAIQLNTSTLTTASNAANAITVRNATTAALGNLTTGATGTTTLGVGGDITGAVTQTAATAITTGALTGNTAGAVTLGLSNAVATLGPFATNGAFTLNDAGGGLNVAGAVTTANNGVASITTTGGDLAVAVGGSIAGAGVSLTTIGANDITLAGSVNGNAGAVTLDSGQAISQVATGTINTTGALVLNAGAAITLDQANTIANLGAVTRGGAFTLNDTTGGLTLTGSVGTDASAVSITTAGGALALGANNIAATTAAGTITLAGVGVTQTTGSITTTGGATTTVNAGTGSIDLQSATNDFTGAVTLSSTGASAAVRDANALTLAAPTLGANTGLTAIAGTTLTLPLGDISTGTGSINLQANGGTLTTPGTLNTTSGSITLVGSTGLTIANDLTTTSGAISLTGGAAGGLTVNTGVSVNAGNNTIIASGGGTAIQLNDSTLTTTSNAANAITVRDATTVALGNLSTGATGTTTLGVAADIAGALTQTTATAINTGTLTASTGGAITLDKANTIANLGAVTRGGAFTLNDTTGGLTLTGSV